MRARLPACGWLSCGVWGAAGFKDRNITWRHMANQISCYEIGAKPGTAFDYNDWQMELFFQTLTLKAWGRGLGRENFTLTEANTELLQRTLAEPIGCEDGPTWLYYGLKGAAAPALPLPLLLLPCPVSPRLLLASCPCPCPCCPAPAVLPLLPCPPFPACPPSPVPTDKNGFGFGQGRWVGSGSRTATLRGSACSTSTTAAGTGGS